MVEPIMLESRIKNIPIQDQKALYYAFENNITYIYKSNGFFIAVNIRDINSKKYTILEETGVWSYGRIENNENNKK